MICPFCNKDTVHTFMIDPVECPHCNKTINIELNVCKECEIMFKSVDGVFINGSDSPMQENFIESIDSMIDVIVGDNDIDNVSEAFLKELLNDLGDCADVKEIRLTSVNSMSDYIHKCLKCNAIAYETSPGKYICSECGFIWEIVGHV